MKSIFAKKNVEYLIFLTICLHYLLILHFMTLNHTSWLFKYNYFAYKHVIFLESFKINTTKYKTVYKRHAGEIITVQTTEYLITIKLSYNKS